MDEECVNCMSNKASNMARSAHEENDSKKEIKLEILNREDSNTISKLINLIDEKEKDENLSDG